VRGTAASGERLPDHDAEGGVDSLLVVPERDPLDVSVVLRGSRVPSGGLVARAVKRLVDIVASSILLVMMVPIAVVIAVAIEMDSHGPVLFSQRRVGRHRRSFPLLKFRTMVPEDDVGFESLLAARPDLRVEWERCRKLRSDPRVTRVGCFLRKHSIDEIPQILNVLLGHMSLVGPRPVREDEVDYFGGRAEEVLSVRPGLTGLWAVSGRSDLPYDERAELEARYAREWNMGMDLRILVRTLPVVVRGRGAY